MGTNISKEVAISALEQIQKWANAYPSCLSEKNDFAKGYKQGILFAKYIVRDLLAEYAGMIQED